MVHLDHEKKRRCLLRDTLYVPGLSCNLLSVAKASQNGVTVEFHETGCVHGLRCFLGINNEERGQKMKTFECALQSSWCIKRVSEQSGDVTNVTRACSSETDGPALLGCDIKSAGGKSTETCFCDENLCNSGMGHRVWIPALAALVVA
eukprot:maker-scaffold1454_size40666-snap-gene-0.8 protein:Tk04612 transcript:maker-scaffold1454_size40666-snap-gene-0.8-mRNA-1 annotation:"putative polyprotein"